MPASLMTVVYARENALDVPFLTCMLSIALPTSILFSFLLFALLAHIPPNNLIIGGSLFALSGLAVAVIFRVATGKATSERQEYGKTVLQVKQESHSC